MEDAVAWRPVRWVYRSLGLLSFGFLVVTLARPAVARSFWLDEVLTTAVQVLAAGLCIWRSLFVRPRHRAWLPLGIGLLLWSLGDVYWTVAFGTEGAPGPSPADIGYLAFYPLAYLTIVRLLRSSTSRFPSSLWWDGIVVGFGAAAMSAAFAFGTIQHASIASPFATVVNLSYPGGDLILVMLVMGVLTLLRGRLELRWLLLAVGALVMAFADTGYLLEAARGQYIEGGPIDALWPLSILAMSAATWAQPRKRAAVSFSAPLLLFAPLVAASSAGGILVYGNLDHVSLVALGLAVATLTAAGVRLALGVRDATRLGESRRLALTDELTGLGNRRRLLDELQGLRSGAYAMADRLALLLIDLDRFKEVNDAFGHPVGDELLTAIGPRLQSVLRVQDVVTRLGGDEFAVVLTGADSDHSLDVAHRVVERLSEPFALTNVSVHVGASVGIALSPEHGNEAADLLRCADVAMYRAKGSSSRVTVYDATTDDSRSRFQLMEELRLAIDRKALMLHYQPKVDLASGHVRSVEALVRWPRPGGAIGPDTFIPLAEEGRLMRPLTRLVLSQALAQCAQWARMGTPVAVAVNLSATNLLDDDLPEEVTALLSAHDVPPGLLILEITESTLMTDPSHAREVVARLHELGVRIAVDDFGTGYSSLAYLRELPVDELKLDRTFVSPLGTNQRRRDTAIATSAVALGHALGLSVVAEGVEEPETLRALAELGFDAAQGYYLGRPVPAEDVAITFAGRGVLSQA